MSTTYGRNTSPTDDLALLLGDATPRVVRTAAAHGIRLAEDGTEYVEQPNPEPGLPPVPEDDDDEDPTHVRTPAEVIEGRADPAAVAASRAEARIAHTAAAMDPATALL